MFQEIGVEPAKKLLEQIGGWPVLQGDSWNGEDFKWYEQTVKMAELGINEDYIVRFVK